MKNFFITAILITVSLLFCNEKRVYSDDTITIATFNIQIFGVTKRQKIDVMDVLTKTVRHFDIIAVQEFRDKTQKTLPYFVKKINDIDGDKYEYIGSSRLGRTSSKERYAFIYNTKTVKFNDFSYVYNDSNDVFEREPFVAYFSSGDFDYVLINIHTKPDDATNEIDALDDVVKDAEAKLPNEKDFIVLGDLNADCSYFNDEADNSDLETEEYFWVVADDADTTVKKTVCAYDRIVFKKEATLEDYTGNWEIFRFDKEYNLSQKKAEKVSDHYPVWSEFFTDKDDD